MEEKIFLSEVCRSERVETVVVKTFECGFCGEIFTEVWIKIKESNYEENTCEETEYQDINQFFFDHDIRECRTRSKSQGIDEEVEIDTHEVCGKCKYYGGYTAGFDVLERCLLTGKQVYANNSCKYFEVEE